MNVSSISQNDSFTPRRNLFIRYSNSFMSMANGNSEAVEKALYEKYGNDVEISIVNGGQPIYYFIISVE